MDMRGGGGELRSSHKGTRNMNILKAVHAKLVEQYMADHPEADEDEAEDATANEAAAKVADRLTYIADEQRQRRREGW